MYDLYDRDDGYDLYGLYGLYDMHCAYGMYEIHELYNVDDLYDMYGPYTIVLACMTVITYTKLYDTRALRCTCIPCTIYILCVNLYKF